MRDVAYLEKGDVTGWVEKNNTDVLVTAGAGDIDALVPAIKEALMKKKD